MRCSLADDMRHRQPPESPRSNGVAQSRVPHDVSDEAPTHVDDPPGFDEDEPTPAHSAPDFDEDELLPDEDLEWPPPGEDDEPVRH